MTLNFPDNPVLNQTYSYGSIIWRYDGEKWRVTGTASQPTVQVSSGMPAGASDGDAWVDSDDGALYVYYDSFWIAPTVNYALPTSAVNTNQIANGAVTTEKLANGPTYTSALPTSATAFNGQEIYYQASSANSIIWHLRYNSTVSRTGGTGAWEFLGGPSLESTVVTNATRASSTYGDLSGSVGPEITFPTGVAGDYELSFGAGLGSPGTGGHTSFVSPAPSSATPNTSIDGDGAVIYQNGTESITISVARQVVKTGISGAWKLWYRSTNSNTIYVGSRFFKAIPVRIWRA